MLAGETTVKRHLGGPRGRWEYNIRRDRKKIGINSRNWTDSTHDRNYGRALTNTSLNLRVS